MNTEKSIWILDDDRSIRWVLEKALKRKSLAVESFERGDDLIEALQYRKPNVVISDIRMPGIDGLSLLKKIGETDPQLPVIIMTAHSDLQSAVDSYEGGAFEYLPKPFDLDEVVSVARRALDHCESLKNEPPAGDANHNSEIIGEAAAMQEVFRAIGRLAKSNVTVMITGQSGTGKELVARALHRHSPRQDRSFIALNMAAIPADLIESELFGHEKGAFTGANARREGRFEQANGGTLLLDEIGDMPAEAQTRLLRVLADGEFYRVGGHTPVRVDVRIITATHQNLEELVEKHRFREDLFHRLNVIRIHLPKLADRAGDIPALTGYFMRCSAKELAMEEKELLAETAAYLSELPWPGNVRQLENVCRWLTVMAPGREIHVSDLPPELLKTAKISSVGSDQMNVQTSGKAIAAEDDWPDLLAVWASRFLHNGQRHILKSAVPIFETTLIETALKFTQGRKQDAAELLGWGRNTLTRKLRDLNLADYREEDGREEDRSAGHERSQR